MEDLNDLAYFVNVVDHGGFAPAARALGMQKSKLSRRVAALEARLGVRLIQRSTRRFSVTGIGQIYHQHCQAMLEAAAAAQAAIDEAAAAPRGLIRMACPPDLLSFRFGAAVARFMAAHPAVEIRLKALNRPADVIQEGFDLLIRTAPPETEQASVAMRRLGALGRRLVMAPALLGAGPPIASPADLTARPGLGADPQAPRADGRDGEWRLVHEGGAHATLRFAPRLAADNLPTLRAAALAGVGIAALPALMVEQDLAEGRLIDPLPGWRPPDLPVFAIFPSRRGLLPSMRALLDHLAGECAPYRSG